MSVETHVPHQEPRTEVEKVLQWIEEDSYVEAPGTPQTRQEAKDSLSPQQIEDQKRAGKLVLKVLRSGASRDQVIPVDRKLSRGRTSPLAIALAQENLRAHGIDTTHEKAQPVGNGSYDGLQFQDMSPSYDVLRVSGIDEDRANITSPKHVR